MSAVLKYIFGSAILIVVTIGLYFGYSYYRSVKNPTASAYEAIPPETGLFIEINSAEKFLDKLTNQTDFWLELAKLPEIKLLHTHIQYFDSIFNSKDEIQVVLEEQNFIIAMDVQQNQPVDPIYIGEIPAVDPGILVDNFVKDINGDQSIILNRNYRMASIRMVNIAKLKKMFFYTVYKSLFIGSFSEEQVKKSIDQLDLGESISRDKNFRKMASTAGKNVDAHLYLNYQGFTNLANSLIHEDYQKLTKNLPYFADWTETDLLFNNNELLLNGYTITKDTAGQLLNLFEQEPQEIKIPEILPYDVSFLFDVGFESFRQFYSQLKKTKDFKLSGSEKSTDFEKEFNINLESEVISWIGNEIALVKRPPNYPAQDRAILVIHSHDIKSAVLNLKSISKKIDRKRGLSPFSETSGEYLIGQINLKDFTEYIFGSMFNGISEHYYLPFKDYIVFANDVDDLTDLINHFYLQKTLAENYNYKTFTNNISDRSNIYFYCNIRNASDFLTDYLSPGLKNTISDNDPIIRNFEGLAMQFSFVNRMFYTNFYVKYNPDYLVENPSAWDVELETEVASQPCFIQNHNTGKWNVIAFDKKNNMYLIDHAGQIKWKIPVLEQPKSEIYMIDFYGDGKYQYLFNTENYFYLVDLNGNYVDGYPVNLITKSTNPLAVFDYDKKKDYRILLAMADNRIYNFNKKAEMVEGWIKVQAASRVIQPVNFLSTGTKDYLFITDEQGKLNIVNRRGEPRIDLPKDFKKAMNSGIHINNTNNKGLFITTDQSGKLVYIQTDGKISKTDFGEFSPNHYFLYEDFTGNNTQDFIFIDGDQLKVFDRFRNLILEHQFDSEFAGTPVVFENNGESFIAVWFRQENKVVIFDKNGKADRYQNISGDSPFIVGSLNNNNQLNLIIGSGTKILNYLLD
ncbi:MAG: DUF3352 domain-containing protein [Bacteroidales bacterium]|nr:DUF3352 domain-containing protein [Bacteroidales bacterium]